MHAVAGLAILHPQAVIGMRIAPTTSTKQTNATQSNGRIFVTSLPPL